MNETLELLTRTLCDLRPKASTNAAYLYCQTKGNEQSVFHAARFLLNNSVSSKILILQTKAKSGYPGFAEWSHQLQELGLPMREIEGIKIEETAGINTLVESEALIRFAKQQGYSSLFVVSPPFHLLRAFMTAVTVAIKEYPELLIYSYPGVTLPWQEEVAHSQGALRATRCDLIHEEFERIDKYQNKGDLASYKQVLSYLNNRKTAV